MELSGLSDRIGTVVECAWSYGWRSERAKRIIDILVQYRCDDGATRALVVEAKRPRGRIGDKDLTPATYLDVPELAETVADRSMLYLVDDADVPRALEAIDAADKRWCILTHVAEARWTSDQPH